MSQAAVIAQETAQRIEQLFTQFGRDSVEIIKTNMRKADQVATGETMNSLKYKATPSSLVVSGKEYIWALETGRKPYQGGNKRGFADKLLRWMQAKGISSMPNKTDEQTARFFAWYINKFGSKLYREGGRTDIITPIFAPQRFRKLNKDLQLITVTSVAQLVRGYVQSVNQNQNA